MDTINRCPHDRENPYAQISRALIRDKSISLECRAFIIYCLSFNEKWEIKISFVAKQQGISKGKIYRIVDEAIEGGYLRREEFLDGNMRRYRYFISEYPKFKEFFRRHENRDIENRDPENQDTTNKQPKEKAILRNNNNSPSPLKKEGSAADALSNMALKDRLRRDLEGKMSDEEFEHGWKILEYKMKLGSVRSLTGYLFKAGKEKWAFPTSSDPVEENGILLELIGKKCTKSIEKNLIFIGFDYLEFPWSPQCRKSIQDKDFKHWALSHLKKMGENIDDFYC